jgi:hypothetical protein
MHSRCVQLSPLLVLPVLLAGCATHADRLREVRSSFYAGNVDTTGILIDKYANRYGREADTFMLDRAMVELAAGRPKHAEQILRKCRDSLDYNSQSSALETTGSMLTDDTYTAYAGEDYEKILVRAMLALSSLMTGGDDAKAYSLQTSEIQQRIIDSGTDKTGKNPKLAYQRVALGEYIGGVLHESNHMDYNDAAQSWFKVCSWEPTFPYGRYDLERAMHGHHSQRGNGVLYVFALVGRGPYKVESVEVPSTVAMFLASAIISNTAKHTVPPSIAPIKVPKVIVHPNTMNSVSVAVNNQTVGATGTITDIGRLATQQYQAIYPHVLARAVVRRAVKQGVIYGAKEGLRVGNQNLTNVAMDIGGIIWQASESADTRCWGLLPDRIQVLRVELPAGDHRISLRPDGGFGAMAGYDKNVRIADGRNTYVMATFADGHLIGNVLSSDNDQYIPPPKK